MDIGDFVTSTRTLIRIFVILLYVPVGVVCYWRLIPRMSPTAKRLASVMMVAQIIVIAISLEYRPESEFEAWLWNLHKELNIPNVLSSTQLALVGGFALITAWLARARSAWLRLYWVGIGLVFAYLGTDEFFDLAASLGLGSIRGQRFMMLGAAMVLATTLVALRSPRRAQLWHGCLLAGLSFIAMGGLVLDELPEICGNLGFLRIEGCLNFQTPEEVIELLGGWLALVAMLGQFSDEIPTPQARVRRPLYALPALWILLLTHQSLIPDLELRLMARPASVQFESEVHLQGYRIESAEGAYNIRLFVGAHGWYYPGRVIPFTWLTKSAATTLPAVTDIRVGRLACCLLLAMPMFIDNGWRSTSRRRCPPTARFGWCSHFGVIQTVTLCVKMSSPATSISSAKRK